MSLKGIVLAGGRSRRFGSDKALAEIDQVSLIQKSAKLLRGIKLDPIVITNESADYSFLNCRIERDIIPNRGPLGGLHTAFETFPDISLLVLTCDMPFLKSDALSELLNRHQSTNQVTLYSVTQDRYQPFPGIYHSSLNSLSQKMIQQEDLSLQNFIRTIPQKELLTSRLNAKIFRNINEKKDLPVEKLQEKSE